MAFSGILTKRGGIKEVKIINAERTGGAMRETKKSLLLREGEVESLLPAIERRKKIGDKRRFRTAKFKNRNPE